MIVKIIDNSGAYWAECIGCLGNSRTRNLRVGSIIKVVVKNADPNSQKVNVKNNSKCVFTAVVISTRRANNSKYGVYKNFQYNTAILVKKNTKQEYIPIGNTINNHSVDLTCWVRMKDNLPLEKDSSIKKILATGRGY